MVEREQLDINEVSNSKLSKNKKDMFKWQMRDTLARKMSSTIWGQKYIFQARDLAIENKFGRLEKINNLPNLFGFIERELSLNGRVVVTINKSKSGDILLNIPNPFYLTTVGKAFVQPELAVIYQKFTVENHSFIVKSRYDTKKVISEVYKINDQNETIRVWDQETEILEMLQIEKEWNHDLGFVPVVEFTNLPYYQYDLLNNNFFYLSDWAPGTMFEEMCYTTLKNLKKELVYCHSRIGIENANQELMQEIAMVMKRDGLDDGEDFSDFIIETDVGANFKVQPGNGDFTKYTSVLDHLMDFYFKFCGSSRFSEGGGAQKTVAETSTVRSAMIESVNNKIILREAQIMDLLKKCLCAYGVIPKDDYWFSENPFSFKINGNISRDETTFIDNLQKQVSMGTMSLVDAIQEIDQISEQEAQVKFERINKFNDKYGLNFNFNDFDSNSDNDSNFDKETGTHKQADKNGEL